LEHEKFIFIVTAFQQLTRRMEQNMSDAMDCIQYIHLVGVKDYKIT